MRLIIVTALLCFVVAGCSSEPVSLPVDATPTSWELQARRDADRDQKRRGSIESKKRKAEQEIGQASDREAQAKVKQVSDDIKSKCCVHLYQLLQFIDEPSFKAEGFSETGVSRYYKWKVSVLKLQKEVTALTKGQWNRKYYVDNLLKWTPSELLDVAEHSLEGKISEKFLKEVVAEMKKRIGYSDYLRNLKK